MKGQLPNLAHLDAVVNLAGGFAMGTAEDPAVLATTMAMVESSVYSSIVASYVSSQMLKTGGLLILPGAAAAWSPTAWSLPYGTAKVAVHHLVRSLAESDSLPSGTKTSTPSKIDKQCQMLILTHGLILMKWLNKSSPGVQILHLCRMAMSISLTRSPAGKPPLRLASLCSSLAWTFGHPKYW